MDEFFESTIGQEKFTLLGQELQPLSIAHQLHLHRLNCLPAETAEQLLTAVVICACAPQEIESTLNNRWLGLKVWIWKKFLGKIDWAETLMLWQQYFDEQTRTPEIFQTASENSTRSGSPWLWHLKVSLQGHLNFTEEQALCCPYTVALWNYYTWHEMQGSLEIADKQDIEEKLEWLEKNEDEILKEAWELKNNVT